MDRIQIRDIQKGQHETVLIMQGCFLWTGKIDDGINCYDKALKISNTDDPEILKCKLDAITKLGAFNEKYEHYYDALECYNNSTRGGSK